MPMEKKNPIKQFVGLDLSRECYGKIYKALSGKAGKIFYNIFELYDQLSLPQDVSFATFYSALTVFGELGLVKIKREEQMTIYIEKKKKKDLLSSKIYNKLLAIKKAYKGE